MNIQSKYTKDQIEAAVKISNCWREVLENLNSESLYRGSESHIKKRAQKFGVDFSHFIGMGWNKGKKIPPKYPIEDYFNGRPIGSNNLKKRILSENIKDYKCESCLLSEWLDKPIPLELHHFNLNPNDNSLDNLRILCPNCHSHAHRIHNQSDKSEKKTAVRRKKYEKRLKTNSCLVCHSPAENKYCSYTCAKIGNRKVIRPTLQELEDLMTKFPMTQIGKMFGVSDNAVRNWIKQYKETNNGDVA